MDECNSGERREVGHTGVAGVQQPEFVELPVVYAVAEQGAHFIPGRAPSGELVLDHPLPKRLGDDRPEVVDADAPKEPLPIGIRRNWSDAIDHRVREGAVLLNPSR